MKDNRRRRAGKPRVSPSVLERINPQCRRDRLRGRGALCGGAAGSRPPPGAIASRRSRAISMRLADWLIALSRDQRRDGSHRRVLDPGLRDPGGPRLRGAARERAPRQARAGTQERRVRLRVAPRAPQRRACSAGVFAPPTPLSRCAPTAPSADARGERRDVCPADAEGAGADERPTAARRQRHHRRHRAQNPARHRRRAATTRTTSPASRLSVSRVAGRDHRRADRPLSARAPLRLATKSGALRHVSDPTGRL